jgi:hypothetical protein
LWLTACGAAVQGVTAVIGVAFRVVGTKDYFADWTVFAETLPRSTLSCWITVTPPDDGRVSIWY